MEQKRGLIIFFNDGSKLSVDYPANNPTRPGPGFIEGSVPHDGGGWRLDDVSLA